MASSSNKITHPPPKQQVEELEADLAKMFKSVTEEIVKAYDRIQKEAQQVQEMQSKTHLEEKNSTQMSLLSILLIVAAVVTVLGLLIAWPVYCVLRKRGDSEDERETEWLQTPFNSESVVIERPKAPVLSVSLQTSVESIEPSAEPAKPLNPPIGSAEVVMPSRELDQPVVPKTLQKTRSAPKNTKVLHPRKPIPGSLSPIGLSPRKKSL
uniref:Uncharacterized protein n=1 Tax=Caenorhabditis japonica TaxID=281687 RepID=A0A8R1DP44_CAEJA